MGFNSAFKGLILCEVVLYCIVQQRVQVSNQYNINGKNLAF